MSADHRQCSTNILTHNFWSPSPRPPTLYSDGVEVYWLLHDLIKDHKNDYPRITLPASKEGRNGPQTYLTCQNLGIPKTPHDHHWSPRVMTYTQVCNVNSLFLSRQISVHHKAETPLQRAGQLILIFSYIYIKLQSLNFPTDPYRILQVYYSIVSVGNCKTSPSIARSTPNIWAAILGTSVLLFSAPKR